MTLVVARKKGKVLSLVSDTGISLNGEQLGPDKQIPKLCILDRNLAVGFSGSSDLALRAIQAAPKDRAATYRSVTNHFLEGHRQYDTDFILAFGPPLSKLARISGGQIKQGSAVEWIGDQAAFAAFQEFPQTRKPRLPFMKEMLASGQEAEAQQPTFDLIGSMRTVIERPDVTSVFGGKQHRRAIRISQLHRHPGRDAVVYAPAVDAPHPSHGPNRRGATICVQLLRKHSWRCVRRNCFSLYAGQDHLRLLRTTNRAPYQLCPSQESERLGAP